LVGTANGDNDTLISNTGIDTLIGGAGSDMFVVNNSADVVQDSVNGVNSTVEAAASYVLPSNINTLVISGSAGALTGTANSGNDTLVSNGLADTLVGGTGNDTFVINNSGVVIKDTASSANNVAMALVSYVLPANVNTLILTGSGALSGTGNGGSDTLVANGGNDTLTAGSGPVTMVGGAGNDLFVVNNVADVVQDAFAGTNSTIQSSVNATLASNVNTLLLTGTVALTGSAISGNDTLVSNTGVDTLIGGTGTNYFVVNNTSDVIQAGSSPANNTIQSASSYVLSSAVNTLVLTGTGKLKGTANNGNDTLVSNIGLDTLVGGTGSDVFVINNSKDVIQTGSAPASNTIETSLSFALPSTVNSLILTGSAALTGTANSGNDTLISNAGADTLTGGSGNDVFVINNAGDVVKDSSATANNVIQSSVSYVLPTDVNTLILVGSANLSATGNSGSDTLIANGGNDTLIAGAGPTTLIGGGGNDLFVVNSAADQVQDTLAGGSSTLQASTNETLAANVNTLVLTGSTNLTGRANSGNDTLISNAGVDTLVGGGGNDLFVVNNAMDSIQDTNASANNTIEAAVSDALVANVNTLILTGAANLVGTANNASDTLVSNAGIDTLVGGTGNDLFIVNNAADVVQDSVSGTNSTIESSVGAILGGNVNTLVLTGSANLTGTANAGNDTLISNAGADTLIGGSGNDLFVVNGAGTVVQQGSASSNSTVTSSVNFTLPTNVNTLVFTGAQDLTGYANNGNDLIVTNSGNDKIYSGTGIDTIVVGSGNDVINLQNASDVVEFGPTIGADSIVANFSYTLPSGVNSLELSGASMVGTANSGNDTLSADSSDDTLLGGATGNDYIQLYANADEAIASGGNSTIIAYSTNDTLMGEGTGSEYLYLSGTSGIATGNGGNDTLVATNYNDTLVAGTGNDYIIATKYTVLQLGASYGVDTIQSSSSYTLPSGINSLILNTYNLLGQANDANDVLSAYWEDTLVSGAGIDTLVSTTGNGQNTFVLNNPNDVIVTGTTQLADTIEAAFSETMPTDANGLVLMGNGNLVGADNNSGYASFIQGNAGNDTLIAGPGNDTLASGSAATTMVGGVGSDLFIVNNPADIIQLGATYGIDSVQSSINYVLPNGINTLALSGAANLTGTGNSGNDYILGNAGQDVLIAGGGNDTLVAGAGVSTLVGGSGNDLFVINNSQDVISLGSVIGTDTVWTTSNYTLQTGINNLLLNSPSTAIVVTANNANDRIVDQLGNWVGDTIQGGSGFDELVGTSSTHLSDTQGQAAIIGRPSGVITTGAYSDFVVLESGSTGVATNLGSARNVIAVDSGVQATINVAAGGQNILSFGGGVDTEHLSLSKTGLNLVISDGQGGAVTLQNWYGGTAYQTVSTLQVVEQGASQYYNPGSSDSLRNKAIYEFNFTALVNQFNQAMAQDPALTSWSLANGMPSAQLNTSSTQAYGGDLAYYEAIMPNGSSSAVQSMNFATVQSTVQNAAFGSGLQTIDSWAAISGGSGAAPMIMASSAGATIHTTNSNSTPPVAHSVVNSTGQLTNAVPASGVDEGRSPVHPVPGGLQSSSGGGQVKGVIVGHGEHAGDSDTSGDSVAASIPNGTSPQQESVRAGTSMPIETIDQVNPHPANLEGARDGSPKELTDGWDEEPGYVGSFDRGQGWSPSYPRHNRFVGRGALLSAQLEARLSSDPLSLFDEDKINTEVYGITPIGESQSHHRRLDALDSHGQFGGIRIELR